eukprot:1039474-Pelagomonas_calceolata.AAC.1
MEAASAQHADTITRLKNRSSRNPNRNNKVTLHFISVWQAPGRQKLPASVDEQLMRLTCG